MSNALFIGLQEVQISGGKYIKVIEEYFTDERMLKTFPNLRVMDREGKDVFIRDIIKEE